MCGNPLSNEVLRERYPWYNRSEKLHRSRVNIDTCNIIDVGIRESKKKERGGERKRNSCSAVQYCVRIDACTRVARVIRRRAARSRLAMEPANVVCVVSRIVRASPVSVSDEDPSRARR